jgi:hypothetical protein
LGTWLDLTSLKIRWKKFQLRRILSLHFEQMVIFFMFTVGKNYGIPYAVDNDADAVILDRFSAFMIAK